MIAPVSYYVGRYMERNTMNRKKKFNDSFNKKLKKLNAKLHISKDLILKFFDRLRENGSLGLSKHYSGGAF